MFVCIKCIILFKSQLLLLLLLLNIIIIIINKLLYSYLSSVCLFRHSPTSGAETGNGSVTPSSFPVDKTPMWRGSKLEVVAVADVSGFLPVTLDSTDSANQRWKQLISY